MTCPATSPLFSICRMRATSPKSISATCPSSAARAAASNRFQNRNTCPCPCRANNSSACLNVMSAPALPQPFSCALTAFCFRYASMNGWMCPSITACTFDVCSSVRWSFTIVYGWNTYERIWLPHAISPFSP